MPNDSNESLEERLTRLERELEHQKTGLAALGVKPWSRCDIFYLRSNPGTLFNCGELVCFNCIQQWWLDRSPNLSRVPHTPVLRVGSWGALSSSPSSSYPFRN